MTSMELSFLEFHRQNPHVYERLLELSLDLAKRGHEHYGMKGLFEVLRWEEAMATKGSQFKLNNNYTAFYARMIMKRAPRLRGFFRTREQSPQVIE